jgi:hypothetical protein
MHRARSALGPRRPALLLGLAAGAAALALTACADSGYQYVKAPTSDAFFKVPDGWKLYSLEDAPVTDRVAPLDTGGPSPWRLVFDASPQPSIDHLGDPSATAPVGIAVVEDLPAGASDGISVAAVRAGFMGGQDPLDLLGSGQAGLEAVTVEPFAGAGGARGSHLVFNQQVADGTWQTVDQTVVLNGAATRAYQLLVQCSAECYQANRSEIDRVVASWTVGKGRS